jgi:hypothetical protein
MSDESPLPDVFAEAAERWHAIVAEFSGRPVDHVVGLVDASGAGGCGEKDQRWTLRFRLHCWRFLGGPLNSRPLSVQLTTSRDGFDLLWNTIEAYSVVRIRARVVEDSVAGTPQAELVEFLGEDRSDAELNQASSKLQEPVIFRDPEFGNFLLERRFDWYTAQVEWNGALVWLNVSLDDAGSVDPALQVARMLWSDQKQWQERIEDHAVLKLLPLKNKNWLDDDEDVLTAGEFKARMKLESITVAADGSFDFLHNDGDLFFGHAIQVGGSLFEGPTFADIPG